jgi:hypothetical protein
MGTVQVRSLDQPDETRSFPNGMVEGDPDDNSSQLLSPLPG